MRDTLGEADERVWGMLGSMPQKEAAKIYLGYQYTQKTLPLSVRPQVIRELRNLIIAQIKSPTRSGNKGINDILMTIPEKDRVKSYLTALEDIMKISMNAVVREQVKKLMYHLNIQEHQSNL